MLKIRVIPCLLLRGRALVKTVRFAKPSYVGDPINTVRIFNEKEVDEIILLDIAATAEGRRPPFQLIEEIAGECFMPLTYGGGVRSLEDMQTIFSLGVEKIALNSYASASPEFIRQASDRFGSQSVVASIDVKRSLLGRPRVHVRGGRGADGADPVAYARTLESLGAGEILLTSVNRDGTFSGYDIDLVRQVCAALSVPLIACGGASGVGDFRLAAQAGAAAVAAGSLFVYQGPNRAVLINFPSRAELKACLGDITPDAGAKETHA